MLVQADFQKGCKISEALLGGSWGRGKWVNNGNNWGYCMANSDYRYTSPYPPSKNKKNILGTPYPHPSCRKGPSSLELGHHGDKYGYESHNAGDGICQ